MRLSLVLALLAPLDFARGGQEDELRPGLVGEYFYLGRPLADFPEIPPGRRPRFKRVDREIRFDRSDREFGGTKLRDYFFVRWTGVLRVPRAGRYRFFLVSDDGSRLLVDGRPVVSNGGVHEMKEEQGEIALAAGDRTIRIEYYDNAGPAGMIAFWEGPEITKELLPASALYHRRAAAPGEEDLRGIELAVEDARADARRGEDRPGPPAAEEPVLIDEAVIPKGERRPDLVGRVATAFQDGPTLLLTVRTPAGEAPIFVPAGTPTAHFGVKNEGGKPQVGSVAYVWLKPGSKDTAVRVHFAERR